MLTLSWSTACVVGMYTVQRIHRTNGEKPSIGASSRRPDQDQTQLRYLLDRKAHHPAGAATGRRLSKILLRRNIDQLNSSSALPFACGALASTVAVGRKPPPVQLAH